MRKKFEELEFKDGFLFAAAMADEELCRMVLERIDFRIPICGCRVRIRFCLLGPRDRGRGPGRSLMWRCRR